MKLLIINNINIKTLLKYKYINKIIHEKAKDYYFRFLLYFVHLKYFL